MTPQNIGFARVKEILDGSLAAWSAARSGQQPALGGHGATFSWRTRAELLAAVGHAKRLIQPEMIGNGHGNSTNLVIDLRTGISSPALRMPRNGPFLSDAEIDEIAKWIDAGCPE